MNERIKKEHRVEFLGYWFPLKAEKGIDVELYERFLRLEELGGVPGEKAVGISGNFYIEDPERNRDGRNSCYISTCKGVSWKVIAQVLWAIQIRNPRLNDAYFLIQRAPLGDLQTYTLHWMVPGLARCPGQLF